MWTKLDLIWGKLFMLFLDTGQVQGYQELQKHWMWTKIELVWAKLHMSFLNACQLEDYNELRTTTHSECQQRLNWLEVNSTSRRTSQVHLAGPALGKTCTYCVTSSLACHTNHNIHRAASVPWWDSGLTANVKNKWGLNSHQVNSFASKNVS